MRYYLVILFTVLSSLTFAREQWAIVVGISRYPESSGWNNINGANDIGIIVQMLQRNGFKSNHIDTLTNEQATKVNIRDAVNDLYGNIKCGDVVYFHFSGHGQLITDIDGDEKGNDSEGWDEALVPYDAKLRYEDEPSGYKGENHIVDDDLNKWLVRLKNKLGPSGKLVVVLDACHSGGGSRYETDDSIVIRGVTEKFDLPRSAADFKTAHPNPIQWVCISACKWTQSNEEYQDAGRFYGRLSYALSKIFSKSLTITELEQKLQSQYDKMPKKGRSLQEPIIEYDGASTETIM